MYAHYCTINVTVTLFKRNKEYIYIYTHITYINGDCTESGQCTFPSTETWTVGTNGWYERVVRTDGTNVWTYFISINNFDNIISGT